MSSVQILAVHGLPEIAEGDDLAALVAARIALRDGDVVVVAQKAVSKAEGALVDPEPGESRAAARRRLARTLANRIVADTPEVLVVETPHGFVCANAGIDASNIPGGRLALLPEDPDASAARIRAGLRALTGLTVAVVVADTFGRPWRTGQTDVAIGVAGIGALRDERGGVDREGVALDVTEVAVADELAAAADLVRRKADGVPAVVVRGLIYDPVEAASARDLVRPAAADLFRRGRGELGRALVEAAAATPCAPLPPGEAEQLAGVVAGPSGVAVTVTHRAEATLLTVGDHGDDPVARGWAAGLLAGLLADRDRAVAQLEPSGGDVVLRAGLRLPTGADSGASGVQRDR